MSDPAIALERLMRDEWGQVVAVLARDLGDLGLAEDCAQDAVAVALTTWPRTGVPERPGAWITVTARRKALDRLRRDARFSGKATLLAAELARPRPTIEPDHLGDEQLDLLFACCHPSLSMEARVPLTLRAVAGLTTAEIARALLVPEATVAQRIVRAKKKIRQAGIPLSVPAPELLASRVSDVLAVIYLVFNEGYGATSGDRLVREELCDEAIRLARLLHRLLPGEDDVAGLLALLLLTDARRLARLDDTGEMVLIGEQDRARWDHAQIAEGASILAASTGTGFAGPYTIQAAIAFEHDRAVVPAMTDWPRIAALYELLEGVTGSAVVALNRAVAVAMADGPAAGLALADRLTATLATYPFLHATRADLLRRLDRSTEAILAYENALDLTTTEPERRFLARRIEELRLQALS